MQNSPYGNNFGDTNNKARLKSSSQSSTSENSSTNTFVTSNQPVEPFTEQELNNIQLKDPVIVRKQLPQQIYRQNVSIRYLKPPTPEAEVVIVKEVRPEPIEMLPPKIIRQRGPSPRTPSPIILREKPPTPPPVQKEPRVIIKHLSPGPPTRRVIIEKYEDPPPKPRDIIIERWLPYEKPRRREVKVGVEKSTKQREKDRVMVVEAKNRTRVAKELLVDGVIKTDPELYVKRYGDELVDVRTIESELDQLGFDRVLKIADDRLHYNLAHPSKYTGRGPHYHHHTRHHRSKRRHHETHRPMNVSRDGARYYDVGPDEDLNELINRITSGGGGRFNKISMYEQSDPFNDDSVDSAYV